MILTKFKKLLNVLVGNNLTEEFTRRLKVIYFTLTKGFSLFKNMLIDMVFYYKYSIIVGVKTYNQVEAAIILQYHAVEKGFLHEKFKFRFGKDRINSLIYLLKLGCIDNEKKETTQIQAALLGLCKYYEIHKENFIDISDYYTETDYIYFKSLLKIDDQIISTKSKTEYFKNKDDHFKSFASSRKSVRKFTGEIIPHETIYEVIELAKSAPSVCNRQPVKVYLIQNKNIINTIFSIQGGLNGFTENVNQLIVLTCDRSYYYSVGERNQLYIDGGIFLMNLLYSLHYYGIGTCSAHWAMTNIEDIKIQKLINLNKSEKVICIISIGIPIEPVTTTLSKRRDITEILKIIE